jgi:hypothetical protein
MLPVAILADFAAEGNRRTDFNPSPALTNLYPPCTRTD